MFSVFSLVDEGDNDKNINYRDLLQKVMDNKIYMYTMLSICCLLFIVTGIQFWISDYMINIMKVEEGKVFITFAIVCITAPTLGVLAGGYLIEQLGGYTDKRALLMCHKLAIVSACCGLPLPFISNFFLFTVLMWLLLFFGGSIMPGLTGYTI
jgi:hypothetical protein